MSLRWKYASSGSNVTLTESLSDKVVSYKKVKIRLKSIKQLIVEIPIRLVLEME